MRSVPSWNLNCISDKPAYSHPTKINRNTTVLDNKSTTILCILSREQCQNENEEGGGGELNVFLYPVAYSS